MEGLQTPLHRRQIAHRISVSTSKSMANPNHRSSILGALNSRLHSYLWPSLLRLEFETPTMIALETSQKPTKETGSCMYPPQLYERRAVERAGLHPYLGARGLSPAPAQLLPPPAPASAPHFRPPQSLALHHLPRPSFSSSGPRKENLYSSTSRVPFSLFFSIPFS